MRQPRLYFTVTNDLNYDQRMIRICSSLAAAGFDVTLVGRKKRDSPALYTRPFKQKRLFCFFEKGKLFYAEYNLRLFVYLLFRRMDLICAIDLDTILPCLWASSVKGTERIYDAHELFCEMKEITERPRIYRFWKKIEKYAVPRFRHVYTVNSIIAGELKKMYGMDACVIRNMPRYSDNNMPAEKETYILYQGAVNEGRCFEQLIPAMKHVNAPLLICGDGNFMSQARALVKLHRLEDKVVFKGLIAPHDLSAITRKACIGISLFEKDSLNNYYSLANRFFDYIHAETPQLGVNYPAYAELNNKYEIALLTDSTDPDSIAACLNRLLEDKALWHRLHGNCRHASRELCWQEEEKLLVSFYQKILGTTSTYSLS